METKLKSKVVAGVVGLTALAGAGGAVAATQNTNTTANPTGTPPAGVPPKDGKRTPPPEIKAAAKYLGLTEKQLFDELKGGTKSLSDVAKEKGKDVDGLKTAISDAIKAGADARAADVVTHKGLGPGGPGGHGGPPPGGKPPAQTGSSTSGSN